MKSFECLSEDGITVWTYDPLANDIKVALMMTQTENTATFKFHGVVGHMEGVRFDGVQSKAVEGQKV